MSLKDIKSQGIAVRFLRAYLRKGLYSSSFLFFGPEGVGKAYTARNFIKALNCLEAKGDSCDGCKNCKQIDGGVFSDLLWIKPECPGESISIDIVRHIRYLASLMPYEAAQKIFVFEEAHCLGDEAQDALLKTLEEPQDKSIFILITSKPNLLRQTILSRCQRIRFNAIADAIVEKTLSDEFKLERDVLRFIGNFSSGSLGEAKRLSKLDIFSKKNKILDLLITGSQRRTFGYELFDAIDELKSFYKKEGSASSSGNCGSVLSDTLEFRDIVRIFLSFFRDAIMFKADQKHNIINLDKTTQIEGFSLMYELDNLYAKISALLRLEDLLSQNTNEEIALINVFGEVFN